LYQRNLYLAQDLRDLSHIFPLTTFIVCRAPVILATQEAAIRRIVIQSQPRQIFKETLSQKKKKNPHKKRAGGITQGVGPEFKP
jgi:hypothetical protein